MSRGRTLARLAAYAGVWLVLTAVLGAVLFFSSSRETTLASHDAVVRPTLSGHLVVDAGPVLPDVRFTTGQRIGVDVELGKTTAASFEELVDRYAFIASQPEGVEARVAEALGDMAVSAALRGAALALVPLLLWAAVGAARRRELLRATRSPRVVPVVAVAALVAVGVAQPWSDGEQSVSEGRRWQSLPEFLGPEVPVPAELDGVEVRGDVTTSQTRRLIESAVSTYQKGLDFYSDAAAAAGELELRTPEDGETVVVMVTDRHDNIGMDQVARAIGDRAGATAVYDAGDDTSTGSTWEAFSLDSLDAAFGDGPYADARWAVTGNHDNGDFVGSYLDSHGWTLLEGEVVDGPDGVRLLGVGDPRSSGLGNWRDESGLSFSDVETRVADAACAADADGDRIGTILVHDANLGREALARGCADLVLGGHTHVRSGPTRVDGENGQVGWRYTSGTTGGAAYAIAVGSSIRRPADVALVTYRDGRPVGVQGVLLQTNGDFEVGEFTATELAEASTEE